MQRPNMACSHHVSARIDARTMRVDNGSRIKLAQGSSWLEASFFSFSACVDHGFSPLRKSCTCLSQAASLRMLLTLCRYGCNHSQRFKLVFYSMVKTVVAAVYALRRAGPTASMEDNQHAWMTAPCGWTTAQG